MFALIRCVIVLPAPIERFSLNTTIRRYTRQSREEPTIMAATDVRVKADDLKRFTKTVFEKAGFKVTSSGSGLYYLSLEL